MLIRVDWTCHLFLTWFTLFQLLFPSYILYCLHLHTLRLWQIEVFHLLLVHWNINSTLQLVNDDLIFYLKLSLVISLTSDAVVFVGCSDVRTKFVDVFEGELLSNPHLILLFPPFLIIKLDNAQILKLQLFLFASDTLLLLTRLFFVQLKEMLLLFLTKLLSFPHPWKIHLAWLLQEPSKPKNLFLNLACYLNNIKLFLQLYLIIELLRLFQNILKVVVIVGSEG